MANAQFRTSAGTTLSISPAPSQILNGSSYLLTDFTALTFTEIGLISDLGSFGKKFNLVTYIPLGDRRTLKKKGSFNEGTLSLKLANAPTDAGQTILVTAASDDNSYCFKVVTQSGSQYFFTGQVMESTIDIGSVDQVMGLTVSVEIDGEILTNNITA